jgi:quercetin dioxygenase-like cupin family protein
MEMAISPAGPRCGCRGDVCRTCLFLTLPAGWGGAQHPSPREQIGICLSGRVRVEAGDGGIREFGAGAIWWMADTRGAGHTTTVLGDEDVRMCIVQLGSARKRSGPMSTAPTMR